MKKIANISQIIRSNLRRLREKKPKNMKKLKPWLQNGILLIIGLGVVGFFAFTAYAAWISRDLPDPNVLSNRDIPQSTKIYDRTGQHILYEIHGDEKRTLLKVEDIPDFAKWATIAIEDKQFYEHHGVYWKGLVRVVVARILKGERLAGASTLTQQLVKNAILTNERSLERKVREFILALQIERRYTKDQILQLYLNEIPYGSTVYGVESAAQTYFGKPAIELTLDEAALLAALPQRPEFFNPYGSSVLGDNRDRLVVRQHYILDLMSEQGYISPEDAETAKQVVTLDKLQPRKIGDIRAAHFVMYVRSQLVEKYGQKRVETGGLRVITTLDLDMQQVGEEEVLAGVEARGEQYNFENAALISLDPKTGQILSMVGSRGFFDDEIDGQVNVTVRPRQPGSSFKPIVYAAAFQKGYLPETKLWDVGTNFATEIGTYSPKNYDLGQRGPISLRDALTKSLNIPAVKLLYLVGIDEALGFAHDLGYTTLGDRSRFGLSLVLGGGEVSPLEHANAYSVFANNGNYTPYSSILEVKDADGKTIEKWEQPETKEVISAEAVKQLNSVLSADIGFHVGLELPDRKVALKTGTTNDYRDGWLAGYTPNLVTVVWAGNNDNSQMARGAGGTSVAAPIWHGYMKRVTPSFPVENFQDPEGSETQKPAIRGTAFMRKITVNKLTGKLATDFTPEDLREERIGYDPHSILYYVDKNDPLGPPPNKPADDEQFVNWESAVLGWVKATGWNTSSTIPTEYDDDYTEENRPTINIESPRENENISVRRYTVRTTASAPRGVQRVEVSLDGIIVGTKFQEPWNVGITIPNSVAKGFRTLTVRAYDDIGNWNEASRTINFVAETDEALNQLLILTPGEGTAWSRSSFPHSVDIRMGDPAIYSRVEARLIGGDGEDILIGTLDRPQNNLESFVLPTGPAPGSYTLKIRSTKLTGGPDEFDEVNIDIVE